MSVDCQHVGHKDGEPESAQLVSCAAVRRALHQPITVPPTKTPLEQFVRTPAGRALRLSQPPTQKMPRRMGPRARHASRPQQRQGSEIPAIGPRSRPSAPSTPFPWLRQAVIGHRVRSEVAGRRDHTNLGGLASPPSSTASLISGQRPPTVPCLHWQPRCRKGCHRPRECIGSSGSAAHLGPPW